MLEIITTNYFIQAIILGLIEGITEFIPVSSTAHLLIASQIINFNAVDGQFFEIVIQVGAIIAIMFIYRKKIWHLLLNIKHPKHINFIIKILLAFFPAVIIGLLCHNFIKSYLFSNNIIALALVIGGIIIIMIEKIKGKSKGKNSIANNKDNDFLATTITYNQALLIGLLQCLAMIPGVSRSGATIIGAVAIGVERKEATEFSFFLAIPTIIGASLFDLYKNYHSLTFNNSGVIFIGLLSAFFSSLLVVKWLINFISNNNFTNFGIYRIIIGIAILMII